MFGLVACANPRPEQITVTLSDAKTAASVMTVSGDGVTLSDGGISGSCTVVLSGTSGSTASHPTVRAINRFGVEVSDADWQALEAYAALTLVPADARSREKGAGAGLVDRD